MPTLPAHKLPKAGFFRRRVNSAVRFSFGCELVLILTMLAHFGDLFSAQVACELEVDYAKQKSGSFKSKVDGWGQGCCLQYQQQHRYFGTVDIFKIAGGVLSGSDLFTDRVKTTYLEIDGEFWLTYFCCFRNYQITPLLGCGIYLRRENRIRPFRSHLETYVVYIPLGLRVDHFCNRFVRVGAQLKVDIMGNGWWRHRHPIFSTKFHSLKRTLGYEAKAWLCYDYSSQWAFHITPLFRYLDLHYPTVVMGGPEPRQLFYYGVRIGALYCY